MGKVSIIIPVYNEKNTLEAILSKVESAKFAGLEKEIILIDDSSTDGSTEILKQLSSKYKVLFHKRNKGKGASIKTGINNSTGDYIVIQDSDLEYNPDDYTAMLYLLINNEFDVVYGSRFLNKENEKNFLLKSRLANRFLTNFTNLLYKTEITDMETCYKAFKSDFLKNIKIDSERFNFEPEITAKVIKNKLKITEIPVSYNGRNYEKGKKIKFKDFLSAVFTLLKYKFLK